MTPQPQPQQVGHYGVYLCCVVEEVDGVSGCPVCGCHESHRMVKGEKPDYIRYTPPMTGERS